MRNNCFYAASAVALTLHLIGASEALAASEMPGIKYAVPAQDDVIRKRTDDVQRKYAPEFAQLQRDGATIGDDRPSDFGATVGFDIKVDSHRESFFVMIPEFKMGLQRIVLTVPEFWMSQQRLVFGTPSFRMERVQVGGHPEWFGPLHMEWRANYMDVPKPFMQEQVMILDLPQVKMGNQEILLHLPEVSMREHRWSFDVPDITVKDVHVEMDKMKRRGAELQTRGTKLANSMKADITKVLAEELPKKRADVVAQFDRGEAQILSAIEQAHKVNVDTSKPFPDGKPGLDQILKSFRDCRQSALAAIDDQIVKAKSSQT